jgi:hypothetical protein
MVQFLSSLIESKKILICIHDVLDECCTGWSREISKNLSDYMINRFLVYGFDVCIGKDENELLSYGIDRYSHAVVIATGTSLKLSDRLYYAIDNKCQEEFYLAGHVLNRNSNYYELHHQFYIVNLNIHKKLGCPIVGEVSDVPHSKIVPISDSDDGYISKKLKQGTESNNYSGSMHGWNILNIALTHNEKIIDLGQDIRNNKKYFYYEYDHVFLRESTSLFYNQYMFNNIVVPFNSDQIDFENLDLGGPIEQYITLGTGLHWVDNLYKSGFTNSTTIYFTDINPLVLQFMKSMVQTWDGEDYVDFYLEQKFLIPNNLPYDYDLYIEQARSQWKKFRQSDKEWLNKWSVMRNLQFKFLSIDYMSEYNFDWFEPNLKTIFNISDMFDHVPSIATQSLKYRIAAENRFLNKLKEKDSNIFILWTARSARGFMPISQSPKFQSIKEIELIDIEKINRPYWHIDDWNVLKSLV